MCRDAVVCVGHFRRAFAQIENGDPTASFNSNLDSSACQFDPAATKSIYRPQWTQTCYDEAYDPTTMVLSRIRGSRGLTAQ